VVQRGVVLAERGTDRVGLVWYGVRGGFSDSAGEWTQQARAQLHQQDAKFEAQPRGPVASAGAHAFDQTLGAEFGQVVAELAETVVGVAGLMAADDAGVQLASGPVGGKSRGMQECLQQTDYLVSFHDVKAPSAFAVSAATLAKQSLIGIVHSGQFDVVCDVHPSPIGLASAVGFVVGSASLVGVLSPRRRVRSGTSLGTAESWPSRRSWQLPVCLRCRSHLQSQRLDWLWRFSAAV